MKKLVLLILVVFTIAGCQEEDFEQTTIFFSGIVPTAGADLESVMTTPVGDIDEGGTVPLVLRIQASQVLSSNSTVTVRATNADFLEINGMTGSTYTFDMEAGSTFIDLEILATMDPFEDPYEVNIQIESFTGAINSTGPNGFLLTVNDGSTANLNNVVVFEDDFQDGDLADWTTFSSSGMNNWVNGNFNDNSYADISNFMNDEPSEDWLISPAFNFDDITNPVLSFETLTAFNDVNVLEVVILSNYSGGDPSSATMTVLSPTLDPHRGGGFGDFTPSGDLDLSDITGMGNIAFHYNSESLDDGSRWQVDNVNLSGFVEGAGGGPGDGGGNPADVTSIADARGSMGSTFTIRGFVTTPDYGFGNGQYFVQDATGGINIFHVGNMGLVSPGNEVEITGVIGEFSGQIQIAPSNVTIINNGTTLPDAISIAGTDLSANSDLQSRRITIDNVTLNDVSEWPTAAIDAGSGVNVTATADGVTFFIRIDRGESFFDGSTPPSGSFTLTGILGRFNEDVQVFPFIESDIQ